MKKTNFITGVIVGGLLFGGIPAISSGIIANLSTQDIYVNGKKVEMTAYSINDNNYVRLRDIGKALDFSVDYLDYADAVSISKTLPYYEEQPGDKELQSQADLYQWIPNELIRSHRKGWDDEYLKYISLDLSKVKFERKDLIINAYREIFKNSEIVVLLNNREELYANGYIYDYEGISGGFVCGWLFSFEDIEVTDDLLVTKASVLDYLLVESGATFTANKIDGEWILNNYTDLWMESENNELGFTCGTTGIIPDAD